MSQADAPAPAEAGSDVRSRKRDAEAALDRSLIARVWYESIRWVVLTLFASLGGIRVSGRENIPATGGALLVSNHLSFLDVFVLGLGSPRKLNYVARSTLFLPVLGTLIRSVGGFPIHFEGKGAAGVKETLKRLRQGAVVILFPEGSRSYDGRLGPMKPGVMLIAERGRVPIAPVGLAGGTFEGWPRTCLLPGVHAVRIEYGPPIFPEDITGLSTDQLTSLIRERIATCHREALRKLARDLQSEPAPADAGE
ncbi:MAG: lysophospholipid acyltransferase family protein [Isosphaeraceae bacterium]